MTDWNVIGVDVGSDTLRVVFSTNINDRKVDDALLNDVMEALSAVTRAYQDRRWERVEADRKPRAEAEGAGSE